MSVSRDVEAELKHYDAKTDLVLRIMGHNPNDVVNKAMIGEAPWLDTLKRARHWMDTIDVLRDAAKWMELFSEENDDHELLAAIIRIHTRIEMLERAPLPDAASIVMSSVVQDSPPKKPSFNKKYHELIQQLSEAQNWRCCYCGIEMAYRSVRSSRLATIEHVNPKSAGGTDEWDNLVAACYLCNIWRGTIDAELYLNFVATLGREQAAKRAYRIVYFGQPFGSNSGQPIEREDRD